MQRGRIDGESTSSRRVKERKKTGQLRKNECKWQYLVLRRLVAMLCPVEEEDGRPFKRSPRLSTSSPPRSDVPSGRPCSCSVSLCRCSPTHDPRSATRGRLAPGSITAHHALGSKQQVTGDGRVDPMTGQPGSAMGDATRAATISGRLPIKLSRHWDPRTPQLPHPACEEFLLTSRIHPSRPRCDGGWALEIRLASESRPPTLSTPQRLTTSRRSGRMHSSLPRAGMPADGGSRQSKLAVVAGEIARPGHRRHRLYWMPVDRRNQAMNSDLMFLMPGSETSNPQPSILKHSSTQPGQGKKHGPRRS
jgi:hypothetical protein